MEKWEPWWDLERKAGREDTRTGRTRYGEDYALGLPDDHEVTSWEPLALEQAVLHPRPPETPRFWSRSDGARMIYERRAHSFIGESESMKTWAAVSVALDVARRGRGVVYVDCETSLDIFAGRVARLGGVDCVNNLAYVRPDDPLYVRKAGGFFATPALEALEATFNAWHAELVILDGVTELMAMHGLDNNDATDVALYHKILLRRWSGEVATLEVDHVPKVDFSNPYTSVTALGSQHKRAGIDGASFLFLPREKGGQNGVSRSLVRLVKDREGGVRTFADAEGDLGFFTIDSSTGDGSSSASLEKTVSESIDQKILDMLEGFPAGNKRIADELRVDVGRVRKATLRMCDEGLLIRGDQQKWFLADMSSYVDLPLLT